MLRFARWSLRGRWERIVTLCLGFICISICTTLLAGLAQLSNLTADQQLGRAWQAPYDLLVRSPAALSPVERQLQVVDPASLEQTYGGISLKQVSTIAQIPHVAIAAPEAVVGWVTLRPYMLITFSHPGLYRVTTELSSQDTASSTHNSNDPSAHLCIQNLFEALPLSAYTEAAGRQSMVPSQIGGRQAPPVYGRGRACPYPGRGVDTGPIHPTYVPLDASGTATISVYWPLPTLLVGIDPGAEQRLVGLRWQPAATRSTNTGGLPLLMDTHSWASLSASVTVESAPLPAPFTTGSDGLNDPGTRKGHQHISTSWNVLTRQQFDSHELLTLLARELAVQNPQTSAVPLQGGGVTRYTRVGYSMSQLGNTNSDPPLLSVLSMGSDSGGLLTRLPLLPETTTPWVTFGDGGSFTTFDASNLPIFSGNNTLAAPLGLYRPEPGEPPVELFPQHSIATLPPMLFTTVHAACALIGEQCISAVRVRIANLGPFGQRSQALLQQVAADIESRTGLHVDVLTGASGESVSVQVAANGRPPSTFTEIWISPHAAVTIANGVNGANVLLLLSEVTIADLALIAAALLSANSHQNDFTMLWRIGWSNRQILVVSIAEDVATALLATLPAWALSLWLDWLGLPSISPVIVVNTLSIAALLYILAGTIATRMFLARQEHSVPRERWTLDTVPWWWRMLVRQVSWRKGNATLVVVSTAGACGLVSLLLLVYWGLDGVLYTTLLGRQVQVSLSSIHLITAFLTCTSAALTAGLTILLMLRERRREFGMLLAIGWTGRAVAMELVREGMILGFLGGVCGGIVAVLIFLGVYQVWVPLLLAGCVLGASVLGMMLCMLGAIYPAFLAGRLSPSRVLTGA